MSKMYRCECGSVMKLHLNGNVDSAGYGIPEACLECRDPYCHRLAMSVEDYEEERNRRIKKIKNKFCRLKREKQLMIILFRVGEVLKKLVFKASQIRLWEEGECLIYYETTDCRFIQEIHLEDVRFIHEENEEEDLKWKKIKEKQKQRK